jgi:hypothetical protein
MCFSTSTCLYFVFKLALWPLTPQINNKELNWIISLNIYEEYTPNYQSKYRIKVTSLMFTFCFPYSVISELWIIPYSLKTKLNSVDFSPQANYTDRAAAACRRS